MSLVDLLITILVATILITVAIGLMTYVAYKLRHARVREGEEERAEGRYFVPYGPPGEESADDADGGESAAGGSVAGGDVAAGEAGGGEARGA